MCLSAPSAGREGSGEDAEKRGAGRCKPRPRQGSSSTKASLTDRGAFDVRTTHELPGCSPKVNFDGALKDDGGAEVLSGRVRIIGYQLPNVGGEERLCEESRCIFSTFSNTFTLTPVLLETSSGGNFLLNRPYRTKSSRS